MPNKPLEAAMVALRARQAVPLLAKMRLALEDSKAQAVSAAKQ